MTNKRGTVGGCGLICVSVTSPEFLAKFRALMAARKQTSGQLVRSLVMGEPLPDEHRREASDGEAN